MEGYGQPAHGYGADPYAAQAYGGGVGAYGAVDPNAAAAAWDPSGGAHLGGGHQHLNNQMAQQMAQPTGDCFPYVANHTISEAAERAGRYPDPITALAFDHQQELLYAGTSDGRLTVFHAPSLERHAACGAHPTVAVGNDASAMGDPSVLDIAPFVTPGGGGVVSVSSTRVACHSTGAVKRWSHDLGLKDPANDPLTCCAVHDSGGAPSSYAHAGSTTAFVGRVANRIAAIDVRTGVVTADADVEGASCREGTSVMEGHAPRGTIVCGGFAGELCLRDPRVKNLRAVVNLSSPAHAAGVSDVAVSADNNLIVTCGLTKDRMGNTVADSFLKIVDVRAGMRPLGVSQFPPGASFVAFDPKWSCAVQVCGSGGQVQRMDVGSQEPDAFQSFHVPLNPLVNRHTGRTHANTLTAACISSSGETLAFGDAAGYVHAWSAATAVYDKDPDEFPDAEPRFPDPKVNFQSLPTDDPPREAQCVRRWRAGEVDPAFDEENLRVPAPDYSWPAEEAPFHPRTPPLSWMDPESPDFIISVGKPPRIIPKSVMDTVKFHDGIGYAPNPHYRRGAPRGEAYRKAAPLQNKRVESKFMKEEAMKAAKSDAAKTGNTSGGLSKCPLPKLYHRVIERVGSHKARFEEFDFGHYNRTRLLGFTNDLANCYVNPVLQMLHFVPELRAKVLMGHTCAREFCLTCELGFLSHMLSQPPTIGAGSHSTASMTCQPLNFLRTLRQVKEAAALGLIEGKDVELDTRLDQSYARRVQAFQRFILEQLHKEETLGVKKEDKTTKTKTEAAARGDAEPPGGPTAVESLFALTSTQTHACAQCKHAETRTTRAFQTDLAYPDIKKDQAAARAKKPTFAECLEKSLKTSGEVRAWCPGHGAYTRMSTSRHPRALPTVMSVSLGMRDPDDLRWWGVNVDAINSHSKDAAGAVKTPWLPHYVRVRVDGDDDGDGGRATGEVGASSKGGGGKDNRKGGTAAKVSVTQAMGEDDLAALESGSEKNGPNDGRDVTYELVGLVCLARRPAEEEDDDSPGGGVDETGARKLVGHPLAFVKVKPPYVDVPGDFSAPRHRRGMTPGVSPIPIAAMAKLSTADDKTSDDKTSQDKTSEDKTSEKESGAVDAGLAAALAAGEAMYGENSGFKGLTPGRIAAAEAANEPSTPVADARAAELGIDHVSRSDWLLFNDFCINPVDADEVVTMYGVCKVPVLCTYARVDKPPPPPLPPSPITAHLYRSLTLNPNLPKYGEGPGSCPFAPFTFESPAETPGPGTVSVLFLLSYVCTWAFRLMPCFVRRCWESTQSSYRWRRR